MGRLVPSAAQRAWSMGEYMLIKSLIAAVCVRPLLVRVINRNLAVTGSHQLTCAIKFTAEHKLG